MLRQALAVGDQDKEQSARDRFMALQRAFLRGLRRWSYECKEAQGHSRIVLDFLN